jgi:quercetin dioxygenase-like cupin family protein
MFYKTNREGYQQVAQGIQMKTLVYGEKTLLAEFRMTGGSRLPRHAHPQEQSGHLIAGRIRLTIGEETREMGPGDSWNVPSNLEHGAEILADSIAVEVFAPVREDYLPVKGKR